MAVFVKGPAIVGSSKGSVDVRVLLTVKPYPLRLTMMLKVALVCGRVLHVST